MLKSMPEKEAEDKLIQVQKNAKNTEKVIAKYKDEIARSEVNKPEMKKIMRKRGSGKAKRWRLEIASIGGAIDMQASCKWYPTIGNSSKYSNHVCDIIR